MSATHTYAILEVSPEAFEEIRAKLEEVGHQVQFHEDDGESLIDMHGIALKSSGESNCTVSDGMSTIEVLHGQEMREFRRWLARRRG